MNKRLVKMHKGKLLFLLLLSVTLSLKAQTTHVVDKKYEECLIREPQTTLHVNECLSQAYEDWDKQLNEDYKKLKTTLNPKQIEALRTSQLKWISFRDVEFKYIEAQFEELMGSMYPTIILRQKIKIVKDRVLELEHYIEVLL